MTDPDTIITTAAGPAYWLCCGSKDPLHPDRRWPDCFDSTKARFGTRLEHAGAIITTMAQQREQERAQDEAHYKLSKACRERAVELYTELKIARNELGVTYQSIPQIDQLLKEIDDAC